MSASLSTTQLAVVVSQKDGATTTDIRKYPVWTPGPGEVLIKNVAVASNPKDWKIPGWIPGYSGIEGNDVAGIVLAVGEGVTQFKGGERVAAFTRMRSDNKVLEVWQHPGRFAADKAIPEWDPQVGAYAQYSVAPAFTTFVIPEGVSFEEGSTIPLAGATAFIGLFKVLGLPEPTEDGVPAKSSSGPAVIINGASSSVGAFAVQLAKRAGLFVVGTAGSSGDYAKSLGVDVLVDYRKYPGEALESALVEALAGRPCAHAYDAVSENSSSSLLARVLARTSLDGKGIVTIVLMDDGPLPDGIARELTACGTAYGVHAEWSAQYYQRISKWLSATPPFVPNRVKVIPNGLQGVAEGLSLLKDGKVHGEKLVYRISETPGIEA